MNIYRDVYFIAFIFYFAILWIYGLQGNKRNVFLELQRTNVLFAILVITLALFVALKTGTGIADADAYFNRYYFSTENISLYEIIHADSFYRGLAYSMSKPVNFLFFLFYTVGVPYEWFVFVIVIIEISIYFVYIKKLCNHLNVRYDHYCILVFVILFYSIAYQFIAFAQGIAMCFAAPILYYATKKSYIKLVIAISLASLFHIAGLFFLPVALLYIAIPKVKKNVGSMILWGVVGIMYFSGIGFGLGARLQDLVNYVIGYVVRDTIIYSIYLETSSRHIAYTFVLKWLFCGCLVLSCNRREEYWKIINVNLICMLVCIFLAQWEIIHRITDIAYMFLPVAIMMYINESHIRYCIGNKDTKRIVLTVYCGLNFVSGLRLLHFL